MLEVVIMSPAAVGPEEYRQCLKFAWERFGLSGPLKLTINRFAGPGSVYLLNASKYWPA